MSMILVALGAVITRWLGEVARGVEAPRAAQLGGWVWAMGSVWLAAALLGAWAPAWPVLPLALLGWASVAAAPRRLVELTSDVLAAFVFAALAVPALPLLATFGLALLVLVGGEALHRLRPRRKIRRSAIEVGATVAVLLAGYAAACAWAQQDMNPRPIHGLFTPSVGVMLPFDPAERVDLDTGAAAWLAEPHRPQWGSSGPRRGALVFHGADSDGSHQKAARVLRRALLSAGYMVLLVDHPGYGQSPTPALDAPIEAWDPLPTALAGLRVLTGQLGASRIMIVGHSMGCVDALRPPCVQFGPERSPASHGASQ